MIAVISKITSDVDMPVVLELNQPTLFSGRRRIAISTTLDQGVSTTDMGYSVADRRLRLWSYVSESVAEILQTLLENNTELTIATWEGVFRVAPLSLRIFSSGQATLGCVIKAKISA